MRCSILRDEQDRELERRGHRLVCYGDHANIYVPTPRSGQRVLTSVERFLWQGLKWTVNRKNSQMVGARKCDYLGYVMSRYQQPRLRLATMGMGALTRPTQNVDSEFKGPQSGAVIERIIPVLRGRAGYFKLSQSKRPLEKLDGWVRHKLRCVIWRECKRPLARARNLMRLGSSVARACKSAINGRGTWWSSGASHVSQALPKKLWDRLRLVSILDTINRLSRIT